MTERVLLGKRAMAPFHLNCTITKKQVCRCALSNLPLQEIDRVLYRGGSGGLSGTKKPRPQPAVLPEDIAYDMKLYYEGYPATLQKHLNRKLTQEKERLMQVADKAYATSFSRFLDSEDEDGSFAND